MRGGAACVNWINHVWNDQIAASSPRIGLNWSHFQSRVVSRVQFNPPHIPLHLFPERPSATLGAEENHICLDKNRSIPRNQIQRRREIPDKVVRYADHTATEAAEAAAAQAAAAASLLAPQPLCFPTASWMWRDNRSHVFKEWFAQKSLYLYYHSLKQSNASFIIFE